jgi:hypothetical protein
VGNPVAATSITPPRVFLTRVASRMRACMTSGGLWIRAVHISQSGLPDPIFQRNGINIRINPNRSNKHNLRRLCQTAPAADGIPIQ